MGGPGTRLVHRRSKGRDVLGKARPRLANGCGGRESQGVSQPAGAKNAPGSHEDLRLPSASMLLLRRSAMGVLLLSRMADRYSSFRGATSCGSKIL